MNTKLIQTLVLALSVAFFQGCASNYANGEYNSENPDFQQAYQSYLQLGIAYMQKGRFDLAEPKLRRAIEIDSKPPEAWNALALLYEETRDIKSANTLYQKLIASHPDYSLGYMNYATFLCKFERDDERAALLRQMQGVSGMYAALAYISEGNCQMSRKNLNAAKQNYEQALHYDNQAAGALLPLAEIEIKNRNFTQASRYLTVVHTYVGYSAQSVYLGILAARGLNNRIEEENLMRMMRGSYSATEQAKSLGL